VVCCWECGDAVGIGGLGDGDEDKLADKCGSERGIQQWAVLHSGDKFDVLW